MMPILERCEYKLNEFDEDNNNMKICVRQFDETICLKTDKQKLSEELNRIDEEYLRVKDLPGLMVKVNAVAV